MVTRLLTLTAATVAAAALAGSATADGLGPPSGTIYAFDVPYKTIAATTTLPDRGPTDTIYVFPDCASCAAVSEAAPGTPGYNGGRWKVVAAAGITTQLTNAGAVLAAASSLTDTGIRFACPLIQS